MSAVFMKNWEEEDSEYCTAREDFEDAQRIAESLQVPLTPINFAPEYWDQVFEHMLHEYRIGRTPNPDILCNREIKFGIFLDYAKQLGYSQIATGHYARGVHQNKSFALYRPEDQSKDQTYFLSGVKKNRLSKCLFPLAEMTKNNVRKLAKEIGLHVHDRKDSTGICFIGERRFSDFLARFVDQDHGSIRDQNGNAMGMHKGLPYHTLGQREGLGIGGQKNGTGQPWYVLAKDIENNEVIVTQNQQDLLNYELIAREPNWLIDHPEEFEHCQAMVRYRQPPQPCLMVQKGNQIRVKFEKPQRAITPGQFVVLYSEDLCLGSAVIDEVVA